MTPPRRAGPPASIHDPITPQQAEYLSAFYWNVRADAAGRSAAYEKHKMAMRESYRRKTQARAAARQAGCVDWARMKLRELLEYCATHQAPNADPHERLAHTPTTKRSRMA